MALVCGLEKLTGGRYLVSLDGGLSFPLYKKELDEFDICEGEELKQDSLECIIHELLPKRAKLAAMNYLQSMDRTEQQLRRKLHLLSYPEEIAEQAVAYVRSYHYIDDVRYAVNYIEYRKDARSLRVLEQELYQRGISQDDLQEAMQQIEAPDEEQQIARWLQKKHYSAEQAERSDTERMFRFLLRKGYSMSAIQRVMRKL